MDTGTGVSTISPAGVRPPFFGSIRKTATLFES
jgi:hypothetical protein